MFLSLNTGRVLSCRAYTVLPMPSNVIQRVNDMAHDQPRLLTFADQDGNEIAPELDIHDEIPIPHEIPGVIEDVTKIPGVDTEIQIEPSEIKENKNDLGNMTTPTDEAITSDDSPPTFENNDDTSGHNDNTPTDDTMRPPDTKPKPSTPPVESTRRSSRIKKAPQSFIPSMKGKSYGYSAAQVESKEHDPRIVEYILTQLTLKAAEKMWGSKITLRAAESEMKQLHWRNSFKPVLWSELTDDQKKMILESHMFMKQKQSGEIKGRTVAGGNKQRGCINKEESSLPTVATESVILSCLIDTKEGRDNAVVDVPNAFIQTVVKDKKKQAIVRIRGMLVDILIKIAPEVYEPYVTFDKKGNKKILVECLNALYGTMVAALLYYKKFTDTLKDEGFVMNPYDPCVWNKTIEGTQCTICFHVDDCKISHQSSKVVTQIIEWLRKDYESIFEDGSGKMKINRGKVHKYLGMTLDFTTDGQVKISMIEYVKDIISAWDKAVKSNSDGFTVIERGRKGRCTAAPEDLFKVNED